MTDWSVGLMQIFMSFIGSLGFSILFNIRGWKVLLAALGGGVSWALYLLMGNVIPGIPHRYFVCACFIAFYAEILARVLKTPATTFLIPAMIPHIPGSSLYKTMRFALYKEWMDCLSQAFYTIKLALALALGSAVILTLFKVAAIFIQKHDKEAAQR